MALTLEDERNESTRIYRNESTRYMITVDGPDDDGNWACATVYTLPIDYDGCDGLCVFGCGADPWEYLTETDGDDDTIESAFESAIRILSTITPDADARQVSSETAAQAVAAAHDNGHRVSDSVALTIAAQWQSPGRVGATLASLASGRPVTLEALTADIEATQREATEPADLLALEALSRWASERANA